MYIYITQKGENKDTGREGNNITVVATIGVDFRLRFLQQKQLFFYAAINRSKRKKEKKIFKRLNS